MKYLRSEKMKTGDRVRTAAMAGCIMTLAAHAYSFFNASFINDRVYFFGETDLDFAKTGKWFMPAFVQLHRSSYLPWLIGMLEIIFVMIAVYATSEVLRLDRRISIWITAGLFVTDAAFVRANFFTGDVYAFTLAMATLSSWIWSAKESENDGKWFVFLKDHFWARVLLGAVPVMFCLATYGAYASVAPTLILFGCIFLLLEGKDAGYVLKRIGEYVLTYGVGMAAYYVVLRVILKVRNLEMLSYMGEDRLVSGIPLKDFLDSIVLAYKGALKCWIGKDTSGMIPGWSAVLLLIFAVIMFVVQLIKHRDITHSLKKMLVLLLIIVLLPFSAGMIYVMAFGNVNGLMTFTYVIIYVGMVKLMEMTLCPAEKEKHVPADRLASVMVAVQVILFCLVIGRGIILTNMAYSGLEKSYTASKSIATRLMERIEDCEGAQGTETVVFIGDLSDNEYFKSDAAWKDEIRFLGLPTYSTSFAYRGNTREFLQNVMGFYRILDYYSADSISYAEVDKDMLAAIPVFPADGCVKKDEDVIYVRLAPTD